MSKNLTILSTNQLLAQVWDYIISRPSKRGEHKKEISEGLFLLCWKAGLRISEALNFDLSLEHGESQYKNLYLLRGKGKKRGEFMWEKKLFANSKKETGSLSKLIALLLASF